MCTFSSSSFTSDRFHLWTQS
uniref:Uncharacterized protein n=1 Tax=Anguilla anguilla TaxID=7936 RepID=A0A0E9UFB1_ANGAN